MWASWWKLASIHQKYIRERLDEYQNELRLTMLMASLIPAQTYYKAQQLKQVWRDEMLAAFKTVDDHGLPNVPLGGFFSASTHRSGQPRRHEGEFLWTSQLYPPRQPCGMSGPVRQLRLYRRGSAHGPPAHRQTLRRRHGSKGGPPLRAGHPLA